MAGASALAYAALARGGVAAALRRRNAAPIFCLHNVVPDAMVGLHGDPSLHVGATYFADLLEWIRSHYALIPLIELAERVRGGKPVHGVACLTFDDAYRGALTHALPLLRRQALPATVFVVHDAAERPRPFWWDLTASLPAEQRATYLLELAGDRDEILKRANIPLLSVPDELLPADWATLRGALDATIVGGSHTLAHRNLSALAAAEQRRELGDSRARIAEKMGRAVSTVSYPYGFASEAVVRAASAAGYAAAVTLGFGLSRPTRDVLSLPRINVPAGLSMETLECWASGLRLRPAPIRLAPDGSGTIPSGGPSA